MVAGHRDHRAAVPRPRARRHPSATVPSGQPLHRRRAPAAEAIAYKLRDPQWCLRQSEDIGTACHALIERLFAHRVLDNLRAAQSVIGLARRFGTVRLEAACQRALTFDDPKYRTVKTILENAIDLDPSDEPAFDRLADTYTGRGRFCRDTSKLLTH